MNGYEQQEIAELRLENWQLRGALGYPVPGDIPGGDFHCGLCNAKEQEVERVNAAVMEAEKCFINSKQEAEQLRSALEKIISQPLMVTTNIKIAEQALKGEPSEQQGNA